MTGKPFVDAANTPLLHAAYDALVVRAGGCGPMVWVRSRCAFPRQSIRAIRDGTSMPASGPTTRFHAVAGQCEKQWPRPSHSVPFLRCRRTGCATRIRAGSRRAIARQLLPTGEGGLTLAELAADAFSSTADCEELLATGPAGTVYLCHPLLVHSATESGGPDLVSWPNRRCCQKVSLTRRCHRLRCKLRSEGPSGWTSRNSGPGHDCSGPASLKSSL